MLNLISKKNENKKIINLIREIETIWQLSRWPKNLLIDYGELTREI